MRTIETTVYKYAELNDKAKEKALESLCDINTDYEWWDSIYDDAETIGLKITGFGLDRERSCEGNLMVSAEECAKLILANHGTCDTYALAKRFLDDLVDDEEVLTDMGADFKRDLLEEYASILRGEYEHLTSREAIEESITANDYEFTTDGKLI